MKSCNHHVVSCINPYELIRKYRCLSCSELMMCGCEKEHGERFLQHQLSHGCVLENQERVTVTLGFQDSVCPECRNEIPIHAPKASMPGATSKVSRYYWREIQLETTRRFYDRNPELDPNNYEDSEFSFPEERAQIQKEVIDEIKTKHQESPKYNYNEQSQSEVIDETNTEVILVKGAYIDSNERKASLQGKESIVGVEEFATEYFSELGYSVLITESVPFHVIFGIYMWPVIQDPMDTFGRVVRFGSRTDYDLSNYETTPIDLVLPSDFGTRGYYARRETEINSHISRLENMQELFEKWKLDSVDLREYLWAHRMLDVETAAKIVRVLPEVDLKKILVYLSRDYWANFCGWPDLLIYKDSEFAFVEVKSSNDKLSEEQKNWLKGNKRYMGFDAKIFKVGK